MVSAGRLGHVVPAGPDFERDGIGRARSGYGGLNHMLSSMIDRLFDADVAVAIGVTQSTIRQHLRRGSMPRPDGFEGRRRWWRRSTIERWAMVRRRPGNPNFGTDPSGSRA